MDQISNKMVLNDSIELVFEKITDENIDKYIDYIDNDLFVIDRLQRFLRLQNMIDNLNITEFKESLIMDIKYERYHKLFPIFKKYIADDKIQMLIDQVVKYARENQKNLDEEAYNITADLISHLSNKCENLYVACVRDCTIIKDEQHAHRPNHILTMFVMQHNKKKMYSSYQYLLNSPYYLFYNYIHNIETKSFNDELNVDGKVINIELPLMLHSFATDNITKYNSEVKYIIAQPSPDVKLQLEKIVDVKIMPNQKFNDFFQIPPEDKENCWKTKETNPLVSIKINSCLINLCTMVKSKIMYYHKYLKYKNKYEELKKMQAECHKPSHIFTPPNINNKVNL